MGALARACHPGPTLAVTTLTALLAASAGHGLATALLVTSAVFAGQLSIGWSNDLIDERRDRQVGRLDKPVARGDVSARLVRRAVAVALVACLVLSVAVGLPAAAVHLGLGVAWGWAYNLGLKRTVLSPVPYAVAFGALPAVVWLALPSRSWPPGWIVVTGALLGVGAHLLNALPDLADDVATGVRGLPHRLGGRAVRWLAPLVLLAGSLVTIVGPAGLTGVTAGGLVVLALSVALAAVALVGRGKVPFVAAVGIAAVDVASLVLRS